MNREMAPNEFKEFMNQQVQELMKYKESLVDKCGEMDSKTENEVYSAWISRCSDSFRHKWEREHFLGM